MLLPMRRPVGHGDAAVDFDLAGALWDPIPERDELAVRTL